MMRRKLPLCVTPLLFTLLSAPASAHRLGEGYIYLNCEPDG